MATLGTTSMGIQDEDKQKKNTTHYVLDTTMHTINKLTNNGGKSRS